MPPQHSYQRARSPKDSGANTRSTFASLPSTTRSQQSVGGTRSGAGISVGGREEWLELRDRTQGTVHTGVVAGRSDHGENRSSNREWRWYDEGGGIMVSTSTQTVVETAEPSWLDDIEIGLGLEERESWKVFRQGEWV